MKCPGGIQLELPLLAISLAVCALCTVPTGYFLANVNQVQAILVQFTNASLHAHYGATLRQPTLLLVWGCIVASNPVGSCLGVWLAYPLKARFGCKKTLFFLGCAPLSIGAIAECIAKYAGSVELLILGMFVGGGGVAVVFNVLAPVYLAECSPPNARGFTAIFVLFGFYAGALLAFVIGLPEALGSEALWSFYCLLPAGFGAIGLVVSIWLPDSPKDLYMTLSDEPKARRNVSVLYGEEHDVDAVLGDFREEHSQTKADFKLAHLFTEKHLRRALFLAFWADLFCACCGPFVVLLFSNGIFLNLGLPTTIAGRLTIALIPPLLLLSPLAAVLVERIGRRGMILGFGGAMIASIAFYVLCGTLVVRVFPEASWLRYLAAVGVLINFWLTPFGPVMIAPFIGAELFPQHARTAAMVTSSVVLNATSVIAASVFPPLLDLCGPLAAIVVFIVPSLVALVALWRTMPETAGKPVNRIVRDFIDETSSLANLSNASNYGSVQTPEISSSSDLAEGSYIYDVT